MAERQLTVAEVKEFFDRADVRVLVANLFTVEISPFTQRTTVSGGGEKREEMVHVCLGKHSPFQQFRGTSSTDVKTVEELTRFLRTYDNQFAAEPSSKEIAQCIELLRQAFPSASSTQPA